MSFLDPVRNMYGALAKVSEEAGSLLGIADDRGLMGVMKKVMGMAPEDLKETVDATLGVGTLDLFAAGDKAAVETVATVGRKFKEPGSHNRRRGDDRPIRHPRRAAGKRLYCFRCHRHDRCGAPTCSVLRDAEARG